RSERGIQGALRLTGLLFGWLPVASALRVLAVAAPGLGLRTEFLHQRRGVRVVQEAPPAQHVILRMLLLAKLADRLRQLLPPGIDAGLHRLGEQVVLLLHRLEFGFRLVPLL